MKKERTNLDKVVDFLMTAKVSGGVLPDHPNHDKTFWNGYETALRDLVNYADLTFEIQWWDEYRKWEQEDEEERRGL